MLRRTIAAVLFLTGGLSSIAFHQFYFVWRSCFNALGRCFDPTSGVVYHDSAFVYGLFGLMFLAAGLLVAFWPSRKP